MPPIPEPSVPWLPFIGALFGSMVVGIVIAMLTKRARARALGRSPDFLVIMNIAAREATDRGQRILHPAHFGVAVTLDPKARRALHRMRVDVAALRRSFDEILARIVVPREEYRQVAAAAPSLGVTPSFARLTRQIASYQPCTLRSIFLGLLLEAETAPVLTQHGASLGAALDLPRSDEPSVGDLVIGNDAKTTTDFVEAALCEHLGLDAREAVGAQIAIHHRGREWLPDCRRESVEAIRASARAHGYPLELTLLVEAPASTAVKSLG